VNIDVAPTPRDEIIHQAGLGTVGSSGSFKLKAPGKNIRRQSSSTAHPIDLFPLSSSPLLSLGLNNRFIWKDVRCSIRNRSNGKMSEILHGVTGAAKSTEMIAVVGEWRRHF